MKTVAEKITMLKDDKIKKRFRIITRKNKDSPAAHYGAIYHTYRKPEAKYPINETIIVFSKRLTDPKNVEKVLEDCMFWGQNHGEIHMMTAVKPLIEKYFVGKVKRESEKDKRYQDFMAKTKLYGGNKE
jgi:DNA-binding Lrp family transcriptional regulator